MDDGRAKDMAQHTTDIPLLTHALLEGIRKDAAAPGQVARSWVTLTRVVRQRLLTERTARRNGALRSYRSATHYLSLELARDHCVVIEFGACRAGGRRSAIGRLDARWDEIGLTGPYRIVVRDRADTLTTFNAVLQDYLLLPPADDAAQRAT